MSSLTQPGNVLWALTDNLGTVRDLAEYNPSTQTTSIVNHQVFSAFGQLESQTNLSNPQAAAVDCVFGFTGELFDTATGLQNNLNRWFDAATGTWLSQDPKGFAAGDANLQRYVGNGPTYQTDPMGLDGGSTSSGQFTMTPPTTPCPGPGYGWSGSQWVLINCGNNNGGTGVPDEPPPTFFNNGPQTSFLIPILIDMGICPDWLNPPQNAPTYPGGGVPGGMMSGWPPETPLPDNISMFPNGPANYFPPSAGPFLCLPRMGTEQAADLEVVTDQVALLVYHLECKWNSPVRGTAAQRGRDRGTSTHRQYQALPFQQQNRQRLGGILQPRYRPTRGRGRVRGGPLGDSRRLHADTTGSSSYVAAYVAWCLLVRGLFPIQLVSRSAALPTKLEGAPDPMVPLSGRAFAGVANKILCGLWMASETPLRDRSDKRMDDWQQLLIARSEYPARRSEP